MNLFKRQSRYRAEHEETAKVLARHEADIVDMTARLVRIEAEVGIYGPVIRDSEGLSNG